MSIISILRELFENSKSSFYILSELFPLIEVGDKLLRFVKFGEKLWKVS